MNETNLWIFSRTELQCMVTRFLSKKTCLNPWIIITLIPAIILFFIFSRVLLWCDIKEEAPQSDCIFSFKEQMTWNNWWKMAAGREGLNHTCKQNKHTNTKFVVYRLHELLPVKIKSLRVLLNAKKFKKMAMALNVTYRIGAHAHHHFTSSHFLWHNRVSSAWPRDSSITCSADG